MRFVGGPEVLLDADVQLVRTEPTLNQQPLLNPCPNKTWLIPASARLVSRWR
jgi:hypothetical protein